MTLLIKGGSIVNSDGVKKADVLIENGFIKEIGDPKEDSSILDASILDTSKIINARGLLVMPGFVDMHSHLREPGFEDKETIETGMRAAAHGGYTTIACMGNTHPVVDSGVMVEYIKYKARDVREKNIGGAISVNMGSVSGAISEGGVSVLPIGTITKGAAGREISNMGEMKSSGAVAFSDDGKWVKSSIVMKRALEYASMLDMPVLTHCEDLDLSDGGVVNDGYMSTVMGLKGISSDSEETAVARDVLLAYHAKARLHVCHISTKGAVDLIRHYKKLGADISCEVTPHHLSLSEEYLKYGTDAKVSPPLRSKDDIASLINGIKDGTIDVIATDHAPHTKADKDTDFQSAAFGISGLETAFSVINTFLVAKSHIKYTDLVRLMSQRPAELLNLNKGRINVNMPADITIVNPEKQYTVDKNSFYSKGKNTPYNGMWLKGTIEYTIAGGKIVYERR